MTDTPYVVSYCLPFGNEVEVGRFGFTRALMEVHALKAKKLGPGVRISIYNEQRADLSLEGWDDGLTDEEKDALLEALE